MGVTPRESLQHPRHSLSLFCPTLLSSLSLCINNEWRQSNFQRCIICAAVYVLHTYATLPLCILTRILHGGRRSMLTPDRRLYSAAARREQRAPRARERERELCGAFLYFFFFSLIHVGFLFRLSLSHDHILSLSRRGVRNRNFTLAAR